MEYSDVGGRGYIKIRSRLIPILFHIYIYIFFVLETSRFIMKLHADRYRPSRVLEAVYIYRVYTVDKEGGQKHGRELRDKVTHAIPATQVSENQFLSKGYIRCAPDFWNPKRGAYHQESRTFPLSYPPISNTRGIYTAIIFIAAISFEPRFMQWFLMSEPKQPLLSSTEGFHGEQREGAECIPLVYQPWAATPSFH